MPNLSGDQIEAIRNSELSMDQIIRDHIHASFTYRFAAADSYSDALAIENAVKAGALGQLLRLNPSRGR
jgi:hypothetical protein